jgi:RND family efflux transporter MFP subunit
MNKILWCSLVAVALFSCGSQEEKQVEIPRLKVTKAKIVDTVLVSEYIADIHSKQNVEIRSKVNGFLESISVDEGKYVKAGQILFKISNKGFEQNLLKSQAALKSAQAFAQTVKLELENVRKLFEKNIVSKAELDKAKIQLESAYAKVEEAQTEVQTAQINLSLTTIRAPFDGIINRIPLKIGSLIDEGTLLTTLSNNAEVYAYFHVSEKEYLSIKASKNRKNDGELSLLLADNLVHKYKGKIETEEGEFDRSTGNIAFRAKFPNPELLLKHGSTGKIQIERDLDDALIIPQKSTFEIQDKFYVFVVDTDSVVRARNIVVRKRLPHLFVVESGIDTTDMILVEGIQTVNDGDKLNPLFVDLTQVESGNNP